MIKTLPQSGVEGLLGPIDVIIEEYGARKVMFVALRAMLRKRRQARYRTEELSDHLRRDLGLPQLGPPQLLYHPGQWK